MSQTGSVRVAHRVAQQYLKQVVGQPQIVCSSHSATLDVRIGRKTVLVCCVVSTKPLPVKPREECSGCHRRRASVRWNVLATATVPLPIWLFTLLRHKAMVCDLCANGNRRLLHRLDRLSTTSPLTATTTASDAYHPSM